MRNKIVIFLKKGRPHLMDEHIFNCLMMEIILFKNLKKTAL
jgi:hypothetical protein